MLSFIFISMQSVNNLNMKFLTGDFENVEIFICNLMTLYLTLRSVDWSDDHLLVGQSVSNF